MGCRVWGFESQRVFTEFRKFREFNLREFIREFRELGVWCLGFREGFRANIWGSGLGKAHSVPLES